MGSGDGYGEARQGRHRNKRAAWRADCFKDMNLKVATSVQVHRTHDRAASLRSTDKSCIWKASAIALGRLVEDERAGRVLVVQAHMPRHLAIAHRLLPRRNAVAAPRH